MKLKFESSLLKGLYRTVPSLIVYKCSWLGT